MNKTFTLINPAYNRSGLDLDKRVDKEFGRMIWERISIVAPVDGPRPRQSAVNPQDLAAKFLEGKCPYD
jgi:hypothetical protein